MSAGARVAYVPYVRGWPIGVYNTIYKAADAIGCSIKSAWYYTTPCAHERADKRKNGGLLIMKVKLGERDNDED